MLRDGKAISRAVHAGAITAVCGLLHSLVDFNLHIPSNALLFLLQVHLATTTPLPSDATLTRHRTRVRERDAAGWAMGGAVSVRGSKLTIR